MRVCFALLYFVWIFLSNHFPGKLRGFWDMVGKFWSLDQRLNILTSFLLSYFFGSESPVKFSLFFLNINKIKIQRFGSEVLLFFSFPCVRVALPAHHSSLLLFFFFLFNQVKSARVMHATLFFFFFFLFNQVIKSLKARVRCTLLFSK